MAIAGRHLINVRCLPALHISVVKTAKGICMVGKCGSVSNGGDFGSLLLYQYAIALADCLRRFDLGHGTRWHLAPHTQLQTDIIRNKYCQARNDPNAAQWIRSITPYSIREPPDPQGAPVVPWSSLRWTITELPFASKRLREERQPFPE